MPIQKIYVEGDEAAYIGHRASVMQTYDAFAVVAADISRPRALPHVLMSQISATGTCLQSAAARSAR